MLKYIHYTNGLQCLLLTFVKWPGGDYLVLSVFFYTDRIWGLKGKRFILYRVFALVSSALFFQVQRDLSRPSNKRISHLWRKITCSITTKRDQGLMQHTKPFYAQGLFYMKIVTWDFHPFILIMEQSSAAAVKEEESYTHPHSHVAWAGPKTTGSLSFFILIHDVFNDCSIQMNLVSSIKICHRCFVLLSAWFLRGHLYISCLLLAWLAVNLISSND